MIRCCDCGGPEGGYTQLPNGDCICRKCYGDRCNNPANRNFGRTGYGCCTPVDVQAKVQATLDEDHRRAVAARGIACDCDRCKGKPSTWVFG